jgi:hypothetical protein
MVSGDDFPSPDHSGTQKSAPAQKMGAQGDSQARAPQKKMVPWSCGAEIRLVVLKSYLVFGRCILIYLLLNGVYKPTYRHVKLAPTYRLYHGYI